MNAIDFLIKEHDRIRAMLKDITDTSHRFETKKALFNTLKDFLIRHESMEQTVWYPHLKNVVKLENDVKHLISEEKHAAAAIKEIEHTSTEEAWEQKFSKIKKDVGHHAEEEESKLFPRAAKILTEEELEMIGKKMLEFKEKN